MAPHAFAADHSSDSVTTTSGPPIPSRLYSVNNPSLLSKLQKICERTVSTKDYPLATAIEKNIPIYDLSTFSHSDPTQTALLQNEWYAILLDGPGVFVTKNLYTSTALLTETNTAFTTIINNEASTGTTQSGDHFAPSGTNSRIWNSFSKHCLTSPSSFVEYYSNPWLPLLCESWLGPQYRLTSQTNIVKPGGPAQASHRDYHLGFQTASASAKFPKAMHHASQFLTLQAGVAHTDMPLQSGPTRFLPFSQTFAEGYMMFREQEYDDVFAENWVALPLKMGDGVFFNPGLHHAAGENRSEKERSANLLQVSSAFGRPMEGVDSVPLVEKCWGEVRKLGREKGLESVEVEALVKAIGEGYSFPTNLDRRPPAPDGMAPSSEQDLLREALKKGWSMEEVVGGLKKMREDASA